MTPDLDLLRAEWAARDTKLTEAIRVNSSLLRDALLERHRAKLGRGRVPVALGIASDVAVMAALGVFLAHHVGEMRFFVPALLLQAWTVAMVALSIHQREALRALNYDAPLVALQARLEALRMARMRTFKWAFLTGQVVWWIPFVTVLFKGLLGVDLYSVSAFMPRFMAWNVAAGLAFIPLAMWIAKRHGERLQRFSVTRAFADSIAGRDIAEARAFLARLARFERDGE
jgi:hypothetical protein